MNTFRIDKIDVEVLTAATIMIGTDSPIPLVWITAGTYSNGTLYLNNSTGGTINITGFTTGTTSGSSGFDVFVTGGTYAAGTLTLKNNTGGTFTVTGLYTGSTDVFTTGGTYLNGSATFTNNTGGTFNVSGFFTGNTLTGTTIIDFDRTISGEEYQASTAITNSNITSNSYVIYRAIVSPDHDATDFVIEEIKLAESDIVDGVGLTLNATAPNGSWGKYYINYKIIN